MTTPRTFTEAEMQHFDVPADLPDVRRDVFQFVKYVEDKGLTRTRRGNDIPKQAARALARLLSLPEEVAAVEADRGSWSNHVSYVALGLGLVSFDTKGSLQGYSSIEPSFPDNVVEVDQAAWTTWKGRSALEKERAILNHRIEASGNEFFHCATMVSGARFSSWGSATGVAGAMKLASIRRRLLQFLLELEPMRWFDFEDLVSLLQERLPHLILDPATREPTWDSKRAFDDWDLQRKRAERGTRQQPGKRGLKVAPGPSTVPAPPALVYEDLYKNFGEDAVDHDGVIRSRRSQLTQASPGVFRKVEGRFLEFFLEEIPLTLRLVDLAYRPEGDPHGLDVSPSLGRLRGVRVLPKLGQVLGGHPTFNLVRVTVLPDFQVIVEAPSYPDNLIEQLTRFARLEKEETPIWTFRIDRDLVVRASAQSGSVQAGQLFEDWSGAPLPPNVATELASWTRRGEKLVIYKDFSLVEILDEKRRSEIVATLGSRIVADTPEGFLLVPGSGGAHEALVQAWQVPRDVRHPSVGSFAPVGHFAITKAKPQRSAGPARAGVRYETHDAVIVKVSDKSLADALLRAGIPGLLAADGCLLLPASGLPRLRQAIAALADRFDIEEVKPGTLMTEAAAPGPRPRQSRSSTR